MQEIIVADLNDQLTEASLDGTLFYIGLSWNETAGAWYLGLKNSDGGNILKGVALVVEFPLLYRLRQSDAPLGDFIVGTNDGKELNRQSFVNNTAKLFYVSEDELSDLGLLNKYGKI